MYGGRPVSALLWQPSCQGAALSFCRRVIDWNTIVSFGLQVVFAFPSSDIGLRSLAVVALCNAGVIALCNAGVKAIEFAEVFGLSEEYLLRLRSRAKDTGSAGLVRLRGSHRVLSGGPISPVTSSHEMGLPRQQSPVGCR